MARGDLEIVEECTGRMHFKLSGPWRKTLAHIAEATRIEMELRFQPQAGSTSFACEESSVMKQAISRYLPPYAPCVEG